MKKARILATVLLLCLLVGCANPSAATGGEQPAKTDYITETEAKAIALTHAKVDEADATFVHAYLDTNDGRKEYEVEFYSGNLEYDYDIDAVTGDILSFDADAEYYDAATQPDVQSSATVTQSGDFISETDAKAAALTHAGVDEADAAFVRVRLDKDNGRFEYEVEFYAGNKEYDYDIDAATGEVLSYDADAEFYDSQSAQQSGTVAVTKESAKQTALAHAGVNESETSYFNIYLDTEDGGKVYDIEFRVGRTEYSYEIDANTGSVIECDMDND